MINLALGGWGGGGPAAIDLTSSLPTDQVGGFGSNHTGGANFCLASGSIAFLSDSINAALYNNLGNRKDGAMMGNWN